MWKKFTQIVKNNKRNIAIFSTMIGLLVVVLLSFYPGILTYDGNNQWGQIVSNSILNNHPFFSTFFWYLLAKIWNKPTVLCVFQIIMVSLLWTSICNATKSKENCRRQIIYTIIICFIPIVFMYVVTTWKDIIYSYALLMTGIMIYIGIKNKFRYSYFQIFLITLSLVLTSSYRYNGKIAVGLFLITFIIIFIKNKLGIKKIITYLVMFTCLYCIFGLPEKLFCKAEPNASGNDIAMFMIAPLVKEEKIDNEHDLNIINDIYPVEELANDYDGYLINSISHSKSYNRENFEKNKKEFYKILLKYAITNPKTMIRHYLKSDNLLIGTSLKNGGYVYVYDYDNWYTGQSGNFDIKTSPIYEKGYNFYLDLVNKSVSGNKRFLFYMPGNILYISILLVVICSFRRKNKRYILLLLPMIYNTISLLPINLAQDLRYAYINYLTLIMLVIPVILFEKHEKVAKRKIEDSSDKIKDSPKTLVIIPAYNEEKSIEKVVNSVYAQNIKNCDVVVVNDGSKDKTYKIAKKTKAVVLDLPSNLGIGGAVQSGYVYAKKNNYDIAIQIDGDGQHDTKYLKDLISKIIEGNDLVIGSRFVKKTNYNQTFLRMLGINIISSIIKFMTGVKIYDTTSGFRAANKDIIDEFVSNYPYDYPEPCTNMSILKKGYKVAEIPVEMKQRKTGKSSISQFKSISYMIKVIIYLIIKGSLS